VKAATRSMIVDLQRPEAYPPPPPSRVELVTTHISWVLLTDHEAWKLKRPVDYGFLDYTTPELRRFFCHEEVRLNRRLAPDVYLGVVPVRKSGAHSFAADGPIVDYAVRMRRLSESVSAEALLRRGALTHDHVARLASTLARFYERSRETPAFGSLELARRNMAENFDQVRPCIGRFVPKATFDDAEQRQTAFLESRAANFRERVERKRIREGHGDLRLEHVYFESPDPVIIDGIEFNERFRMLDAASDVAFLAMEFEARSRPDLAAWFLTQFASASNDFDLYSVVDFYLAYRAWVRGKIACFLALDPATPREKVRRKEEEARRLFELGTRFLADRAAGALLVVGGLTGAGKSTVAEALSIATGYPVISSDRTRKHLAGIPSMERAPDEAYSPAFSRRTFEELFRRAAVVMRSGRGVILDATFRSRELRARARDLAARLGRQFLFVEAKCDDATLHGRLRARSGGPSVSDADVRILERVRREFEPVAEFGEAEYALVDTAQPLDGVVAAIARRVRELES